MATARNRVIYQSESLLISKDIASTGASQHHELTRVQSANYGFTINREDVNQYGNLARIDSLILESPTVNFDFSYYLTNGVNEEAMGFSISPTSQFPSGQLESSSGKNFYMVTSNEGADSTTLEDGDECSVIGLGNAFLSDYSVELSVGSIPTVSASYECSNINSFNAVVGSDQITGLSSAIDPESGTKLTTEPVAFSVPSDVGDTAIAPTALRPGDITLSFPGFSNEGDKANLAAVSGANAFHIQSASLSVPLSRTPIERLGSKFPFARVVDFPVNASLNVSAVLNNVEAANLADFIAGCTPNNTRAVELLLKDCNQEDQIKWSLKGVTLDSESFSSSIGSNKTVDLTFGVQLGGIDDIDQGILCSGANANSPFPG
jgi:hypothetical protein